MDIATILGLTFGIGSLIGSFPYGRRPSFGAYSDPRDNTGDFRDLRCCSHYNLYETTHQYSQS